MTLSPPLPLMVVVVVVVVVVSFELSAVAGAVVAAARIPRAAALPRGAVQNWPEWGHSQAPPCTARGTAGDQIRNPNQDMTEITAGYDRVK